MSSTFSFQRLGKLIVKQFYENARFYLFCSLAIFGLLALVFAFWLGVTGPNYDEQGTYVILVFGLYISGAVFAGLSFNMLGNKDKGIYWLSVPATHLEKLIATIFYSTIAFTIVYCVCFYIVKSIAVAFLLNYIQHHPGTSYNNMTDFKSGFGAVIQNFVYGYFAVQSFYLLGSVYFSRYSLVLTTVVFASLIFTFFYYMSNIHDYMFVHGGWDGFSVRQSDPSIRGGYMLYSVSPVLSNIIEYATKFAWAPLFWIVTWFRLKEKQL